VATATEPGAKHLIASSATCWAMRLRRCDEYCSRLAVSPGKTEELPCWSPKRWWHAFTRAAVSSISARRDAWGNANDACRETVRSKQVRCHHQSDRVNSGHKFPYTPHPVRCMTPPLSRRIIEYGEGREKMRDGLPKRRDSPRNFAGRATAEIVNAGGGGISGCCCLTRAEHQREPEANG